MTQIDPKTNKRIVDANTKNVTKDDIKKEKKK